MKALAVGRALELQSILAELRSDNIISGEEGRDLNEHITSDSGEHPLEIIAKLSLKHKTQPDVLLTLDWLCRWLAKKLRIDFVDLAEVHSLDPLALRQLSSSYALSRGLLPIRLSKNILTIATAEPLLVQQSASDLKSFASIQPVFVMSSPCRLREMLAQSYGFDARTNSSGSERGIKAISTSRTNGSNLNELENAVAIVDSILQTAFDRRASDIHMEPHDGVGDIRIRIDGVLHTIGTLSPEKLRACVSRIKVLGHLDIAEKRLPQDGRMKLFTKTGRDVEVRLSTMPCARGEKLVMRLFNSTAAISSLDDLGFSSHERALWDRMASHPHGLILVTGPTGSGKTTTLYSALRAIATPRMNIATVEDPIEQIDGRFNQMQINPSIGLTFPTGIRTILRQDPDVIMVGEIRDSESADVAVQAALTGHLVFATVHTNDAPSTVTRLLDLNVPPYLIKAALVGVVAQRLVRKLCDICKRPSKLTRAEWEFLTSPLRIPQPESAYEAVGCDECNSIGFRGRTGIYEMLYLIEALQRLITPAADTATIRRVALRSGMTPLRVSGAARIRDGHTTVSEVLRVIPPELERL